MLAHDSNRAGSHADYFMTGVRTGPGKLTMMLIPKTEGVDTKPIKTSCEFLGLAQRAKRLADPVAYGHRFNVRWHSSCLFRKSPCSC